MAGMTSTQERWAEALAVERNYGGDAPLHIAERIGQLALMNDEAGVARWREIAVRLDQLRNASRT